MKKIKLISPALFWKRFDKGQYQHIAMTLAELIDGRMIHIYIIQSHKYFEGPRGGGIFVDKIKNILVYEKTHS